MESVNVVFLSFLFLLLCCSGVDGSHQLWGGVADVPFSHPDEFFPFEGRPDMLQQHDCYTFIVSVLGNFASDLLGGLVRLKYFVLWMEYTDSLSDLGRDLSYSLDSLLSRVETKVKVGFALSKHQNGPHASAWRWHECCKSREMFCRKCCPGNIRSCGSAKNGRSSRAAAVRLRRRTNIGCKKTSFSKDEDILSSAENPEPLHRPKPGNFSGPNSYREMCYLTYDSPEKQICCGGVLFNHRKSVFRENHEDDVLAPQCCHGIGSLPGAKAIGELQSPPEVEPCEWTQQSKTLPACFKYIWDLNKGNASCWIDDLSLEYPRLLPSSETGQLGFHRCTNDPDSHLHLSCGRAICCSREKRFCCTKSRWPDEAFSPVNRVISESDKINSTLLMGNIFPSNGSSIPSIELGTCAGNMISFVDSPSRKARCWLKEKQFCEIKLKGVNSSVLICPESDQFFFGLHAGYVYVVVASCLQAFLCLFAASVWIKGILPLVMNSPVLRKNILHACKTLNFNAQCLPSVDESSTEYFDGFVCYDYSFDVQSLAAKDYLKCSKGDFLYEVLYNSHRTTPVVQKEYFVNPVFAVDRVASFHPLLSDRSELGGDLKFFIPLSAAGFRYIKESSLVSCDGCGARHEMSELTSAPSHPRYHTPAGCCFASKESGTLPDLPKRPITLGPLAISATASATNATDHNEDPLIDEGLGLDDIQEDGAPSAAQSSGHASGGTTGAIPSAKPLPSSSSVSSAKTTSLSSTTSSSSSSASLSMSASSPSASASVSASLTSASHAVAGQGHDYESQFGQTAERQLLQRSRSVSKSSSASSGYSSASSGYGSEPDIQDKVYQDWANNMIRPEALETKKMTHLECVRDTSCDRNDHFGYIMAQKLQLVHLPDAVKSLEVITLLRLFYKLVVRVVVKTSRARSTGGFIIGSGYVFLWGESSNGDTESRPQNGASSFKWLKKHVPSALRKLPGDVSRIYIQTHRHVVQNNKEASDTKVEFQFFHGSRKNVISISGEEVLHSKVPGDDTSILVCRTRDVQLCVNVNRWRQEFLDYAANLPAHDKEAMMRTVLTVSHPHGAPMVVSHGIADERLYTTEEMPDGRSRVVQIPAERALSSSGMVWKILAYTACTCEGSSGAAILRYQKTGVDAGGRDILELGVWMHSGVDKNGCGVSVLKVCQASDFEILRQRLISERNKRQTSGSSSSGSSSNPQRPVKLSVNGMNNPNFVLYRTRLETYSTFPEHVKQFLNPKDLAFAGFFFADPSA
ncbi:uncharacterized protein LOC101845623 isoform X2 [Aplysia californica]|uniref:Uncharacterized protein LOC101845623 isoform X2 n=1 Tax=Aplysia californica TaxID=6500 RepID=A0ABM1A1F9_APLCA|nr:uncharacterized protein LOC101845623 isoform X2 [Aplysia californica]